MKEAAVKRWLGQRKEQWAQLDRLARKRSRLSWEDATQLVRLYQLAQGDLALARQELTDTPLVGQLQSLVMRANAIIARPARNTRADLIQLLTRQVPEYVHALRYKLIGIVVCFLAFGVAGAALVLHFPELAHLFLSPKMIHAVESGQLWTDNLVNVLPSSVLSLGIMSNNIMVVLFAFALGIFYGLGTLYIVGFNGLMLGGAFGFTIQHGMGMRLLAFILPHGFVELSVILLTATCGFAMGESLARREGLPWRQSLRNAAGSGFAVVLVCLPFLVGAGLIEGYISPDVDVPIPVRLVIGLAYEALFVAFVTGRLFRKPAFLT